jgi:deazaflavin-dependent oxidoreductase (nitroreductase family)
MLLGMASAKPISAVLSRTLRPLDRAMLKLSSGRATVSSIAGGQPVVWLTVTGRRSGEQRPVPLNGIPLDDDLAVIGSSFGSAGHPAWALNLEANPRAQITYEGNSLPVLARRATPHEEADIWRAASVIYPGYDRYRERVSREIKVFVLERD